MPDASITSTASAFGSIAGTFAADQSTIAGTITTITGTVNGSVGVPGPQGPQGPQGEEGPPGPPGPGSTWGTITGTLSAQTDLQTALDGKYSTSNPSGFITASALTGYATESWVTAGFYPLTSNPSGFITSSALTPYLLKAGGVITGDILSYNGSRFQTIASGSGSTYSQVSPDGVVVSGGGVGGGSLSIQWDGISFVSSPYKQTVPFLGLDGYATESWVTAGFAPIAAGQPTGGTVGQVLTKNSGTAYDSSWATLIPGDRYLTSSTTSNTVSNGNKTFTIGTGLSYTPTQNITISYDASNHMHGEVLTYNSGTGVLTVDVNNHTGAGTYSAWVVNVGGVTPETSVAWGDVTGVLGDQTDLAGALSAKLAVTDAASTYQTLAGMSSYLTTSAAASTYYPLTNPAGYITSSALTGYATQAWVDAQGYLQAGALTGYALESWVTSQGYLTDAPSDGNQYARKNGAWDVVSAGSSYITSVTAPLAVTGSDLSIDLSAYETTANAAATYYPLSNPSGFIDASALTGYATESWVNLYYVQQSSPALTGNVTITTNSTSPALVITQDGTGDVIQFKDVTSDTTYSFIDANGKVSTIASTTTNAGFNVPHGTAPTTPVNGDIWTTTSGLLARINGATRQYVDLDGTQTINGTKTFSSANQTLGNSTAAGTINIGTGATISGSTKAVNIGTAGLAGSTTNITIGTNSGGTSTTTLNGTVNATTQTAGDASTKVATTAFVTTADNLKANIASPTFTGTPLSTTAAADTNTTQIATTAFVVGQASATSPVMDGTATVGTSLKYARADHVHPTDTSRAPLASPALTGVPTAPTAANGTNTTQIATTAFVLANGGATTYATVAQSRAGTSTTVAQNPSTSLWQSMHPGMIHIDRLSLTYTATGTMGTSGQGFLTGRMTMGTAGAASANFRTFGSSQIDQAWALMSKGYRSYIDFSKFTWCSGRFYMENAPVDPLVTAAFYYGKANNSANGDLARKGFGWKLTGNATASLRNPVLQVHNGTTLTNVTSTFAVVAQVYWDWDIISDGAGNVTLYINGTQVATTSAGPTGDTSYSGTSPVIWNEEFVSTGTTLGYDAVFGRGRIYQAS